MKIYIVDDQKYWLEKGKEMLSGHEVNGFVVADPEDMMGEILPEIRKELEKTDLLLCDRDLGKGVTSIRLLAAVRREFPKLPIIRWTGGWGRDEEILNALCIEGICKPQPGVRWFANTISEKTGNQIKALSEIGSINVDDILSKFHEDIIKEDDRSENSRKRLNQLQQIAGLAETDELPCLHEDGATYSDGRKWGFDQEYMDSGYIWTRHEVYHIFSDDCIRLSDVLPLLPRLKKAFQKFIDKGCLKEDDDRFMEIVKAVLDDNAEAMLEAYFKN